MIRRSATCIARRVCSSRCGFCARAALVLLSFALPALSEQSCRTAAAQSLRLAQAAVEAVPDDSAKPILPPQSTDALPAPNGPASSSNDDKAPKLRRNRRPPARSRRLRLQRNRAPQPAAATSIWTAALERRGDLTLRNSTIDGALFTIGELWHINIVVGEVKGTVNGSFKNAPLREILDTILLSNGYSYRAVGESLVVSPLAQLGQINPFFKSATIPVQSADIDEIVEGAKLLSTPQGQIRAIKSARSIFVLDFPDRVQMIRDFVTSVDNATKAEQSGLGVRAYAPLEVGYFKTQYITAKTAEDARSRPCLARKDAARSWKRKTGCWSPTTPKIWRWSSRS